MKYDALIESLACQLDADHPEFAAALRDVGPLGTPRHSSCTYVVATNGAPAVEVGEMAHLCIKIHDLRASLEPLSLKERDGLVAISNNWACAEALTPMAPRMGEIFMLCQERLLRERASFNHAPRRSADLFAGYC